MNEPFILTVERLEEYVVSAYWKGYAAGLRDTLTAALDDPEPPLVPEEGQQEELS